MPIIARFLHLTLGSLMGTWCSGGGVGESRKVNLRLRKPGELYPHTEAVPFMIW
jgi:hypothetical protein